MRPPRSAARLGFQGMRKSTVMMEDEQSAEPRPEATDADEHRSPTSAHHREFPTGYSSAGCSPAEPASASPAADLYTPVPRGRESLRPQTTVPNFLSHPRGAVHALAPGLLRRFAPRNDDSADLRASVLLTTEISASRGDFSAAGTPRAERFFTRVQGEWSVSHLGLLPTIPRTSPLTPPSPRWGEGVRTSAVEFPLPSFDGGLRHHHSSP